MTSIFHPPWVLVETLPCSAGPLAVRLYTLTFRPAVHSASDERTTPWKCSVVCLYPIEMVLGTAANAAFALASAMAVPTISTIARFRILPPFARLSNATLRRRPLPAAHAVLTGERTLVPSARYGLVRVRCQDGA